MAGRVRGFTLLELVIVIAIIAILAILAVPLISNLRARAQRVQCTANLKSLAVGANLYLQQNNDIWPQIRPPAAGDVTEDFANAWIAALEPFSVPRKTWICPTIQTKLENPDYSTPDNARIDYFATPFDDKPGTSHEWPRQPWFIETGDVHGKGNLILFTDGSVSDLNTVAKRRLGEIVGTRKTGKHFLHTTLASDKVRARVRPGGVPEPCMIRKRISFFLTLLAVFCATAFSSAAIASTVEFKPASYTAAENSGSVTLTVVANRTGDPADIITVHYKSGNPNDSAIAPDDYTAVEGDLTFGPGVIEQKIAVPLIDDNLIEIGRRIRRRTSRSFSRTGWRPATRRNRPW